MNTSVPAPLITESKLANGSKLGDPTITVSWQRRRLQTGTASTKCGATPPNTTAFDAADQVSFYNVTYTLITDAVLDILYDTSNTTGADEKQASNTCGSGTNPVIGYDPNSDTTGPEFCYWRSRCSGG